MWHTCHHLHPPAELLKCDQPVTTCIHLLSYWPMFHHLHALLSYWNVTKLSPLASPCWALEMWPTCHHSHPLLSYWNLTNLLLIPPPAELLKFDQPVTYECSWDFEAALFTLHGHYGSYFQKQCVTRYRWWLHQFHFFNISWEGIGGFRNVDSLQTFVHYLQ